MQWEDWFHFGESMNGYINQIRIWKEEIQGFEKEILEIESRSI
jgi:hypothetical protein